MSDPLATYLHDHLAGSNFAIQLLESLRDEDRGEELSGLAVALLAEVKEDREALQRIIGGVGKTHLDLKDATGWLAEKASRLKLQRDSGGIGTFEALETLTLGILAKLALWRVLPVIAKVDTRICETDFDKLTARAQEQYARVEQYRMQFPRTAFKAVSK